MSPAPPGLPQGKVWGCPSSAEGGKTLHSLTNPPMGIKTQEEGPGWSSITRPPLKASSSPDELRDLC